MGFEPKSPGLQGMRSKGYPLGQASWAYDQLEYIDRTINCHTYYKPMDPPLKATWIPGPVDNARMWLERMLCNSGLWGLKPAGPSVPCYINLNQFYEEVSDEPRKATTTTTSSTTNTNNTNTALLIS